MLELSRKIHEGCQTRKLEKSISMQVLQNKIYLGAIQTDYPVDISCAVIEVGHSNSMLAGGNPVLLSVWVNLEDMSSGAEDGLFPEEQKVKVINLIGK